MEYCIVNTTASNREEAVRISKFLVENKLAACCNIIENVTSVYNWNSRINEDSEVLIIMKTKVSLYDKVEEEIKRLHSYDVPEIIFEEEIKRLHSYDVPEIICIPLLTGSKEYLGWIEEETIKDR